MGRKILTAAIVLFTFGAFGCAGAQRTAGASPDLTVVSCADVDSGETIHVWAFEVDERCEYEDPTE